MRNRSHLTQWLPWAALLAVAALGVGLSAGSSGWGWVGGEIMSEIRAPRVLAGFGCGAALALAGALMQLLTRNALADPAVLGVSGGAAVGAMAALLFAPALAATTGAAAVLASMLGAGIGALVATAVLLGLSWRLLSRPGISSAAGEGTVTLLLLGVMIGSACAALLSLMLALAPDAALRGMVFWLLGDLNGVQHWWPVCVSAAVALLLVLPHARQLDQLARGEAWAISLGVAVATRRRVALIAAALAVGAAVATAGAVGFVGLVVPHALRLLGVRAAPALLPASALVGGSFIVVVDALARTIVAPTQLPVGVLAALIGVPVFVHLLLRGLR